MVWSEKIDNKKYILGSFVAVGLNLYITRGKFPDVLFLFAVTFGSILNQWLMFVILSTILAQITTHRRLSWTQRFMFWLQIVLKFSLLGSIFYTLIVHARHIVAQGLILYTFQLIILILSIKNIAASFKKGSSE